MPYYDKYEDFLNKSEVEYDLFLWDRDSEGRKGFINESNSYTFSYRLKTKHRLLKIPAFFKWRTRTLRIIRQNRYDKLIILTSIPGVLLFSILAAKYKKKYLFDIRDYTCESIPVYRHVMNMLIKNSALTVLSSKGFFSFLKKRANIVFNHNLPQTYEGLAFDEGFKFREKYTIGYAGYIRSFRQNACLIDELKNSKRFSLLFAGTPSPGCDLEKYCVNIRIFNIAFRGEYINSEKREIYKDIDIINCLCGNENFAASTPVPNRLYDCIIYKKPILVTEGTYLAQIVGIYHLGICIAQDAIGAEKAIESYLINFNKDLFLKGCEDLLSEAEKDEELFQQMLENFVFGEYPVRLQLNPPTAATSGMG